MFLGMEGDVRVAVSVEEAAVLLGISRWLAYQAVRSGQIPSCKIGHRLLVPKVALQKMLDEASQGRQGDEKRGLATEKG